MTPQEELLHLERFKAAAQALESLAAWVLQHPSLGPLDYYLEAQKRAEELRAAFYAILDRRDADAGKVDSDN